MQKIVPKRSIYPFYSVSVNFKNDFCLEMRLLYLNIFCYFCNFNLPSLPSAWELARKCWIAGTEFEDALLLITWALISSDYSAFVGAGAPERSPYE